MFRPGNLGHLGRLGLVAASRPGLVAQALAILANYGSAANLYLPGVGAINGITAGNWFDSIGTTAATVDNQVGLVVSAGKAVGPELVTNGSFDSSLSGWSSIGGVVNSWSSGTAITAYSFANGGLFQDIPFTGNTALITVRAKSNLGTGSFWVLPRTGGFSAPNTVVPVPSQEYADYRCVVTREAGASGIRVYLTVGSGAILQIDSVSVRELPGAHLTQSTAANRPVLRQSGGVYAWDFVSSDFLQSTQPFFTSATDNGLCCAGVTQRTTTGIQAVVASRGPSASPTNCANSIFFSSGAPMAYWEGAVSDSLVGTPVAAGVPVVVSARKFGSQISLRVNSAVAQSKTATISGMTISSSAIGASLSGASNAPTLFGNISVSAVAAIRGSVSDADAVLIERLVASLSGVTM